MLHATPGAPAIAAEYVTVSYTPDSGRVVHIHRTIVLAGGTHEDFARRRESALAALRALAGDRPLPPVEVADVDPASHKPGHHHHFDLATRTLVATPRQVPARRSA